MQVEEDTWDIGHKKNDDNAKENQCLSVIFIELLLMSSSCIRTHNVPSSFQSAIDLCLRKWIRRKIGINTIYRGLVFSCDLQSINPELPNQQIFFRTQRAKYMIASHCYQG